MTPLLAFILVLIEIVLSYGILFSYLKAEMPTFTENRSLFCAALAVAAASSVFGFILVVVACEWGKHGLKFK